LPLVIFQADPVLDLQEVVVPLLLDQEGDIIDEQLRTPGPFPLAVLEDEAVLEP
jgi:hypothetical protein